ncbi:MAG: hypothetical protein LLG04_14760 [Parachlamydia sp.]|nr:hypothetical protein [Parachlamydia sp.]
MCVSNISAETNNFIITFRTQNDHAGHVVIKKLIQIAKQHFDFTISFKETTTVHCDLYISLYNCDDVRRQEALEYLKDKIKHFICFTHNHDSSKEQLFTPNGVPSAIPLEKISLFYFDLCQNAICNDPQTDSAAKDALQVILFKQKMI